MVCEADLDATPRVIADLVEPRLARRAWIGGVLAAAVTLALPATAEAADVVVTDVLVPEGPEAKATAKMVRRLIAGSAKRAKWGKASKVRILVRVAQLDVTEEGDVLRVTCTMSGRLEGGPGARSRLSYGGHPSRRKDLVKKVLGMVGDGLVTRLAQMARERAQPAP